MGDLGDLFGSFFGGGFGGGRSQRRNAPQRGESIRQTVVLSFEEAAFGCEKEITVERIETCGDCGGTGAAKGTTAETCPNCRGTGVVTQTQRTPLGMFQTQGACPNCRGTGKIIKKPCPKCGGQGRVRKTRKFKVNIPAGIDDGQSIQQRGQGNAGANGGPAGDLYVTVAIRPHPIFTRDGSDVYVEIPISFAQAALGDTLQVPTIDGRVEYKVPEGTQTGTMFRMRGKGIQNVNGRGRGDQYVRVNIEVPKNLTDKQKKLLREAEILVPPEPGALAEAAERVLSDNRLRRSMQEAGMKNLGRTGALEKVVEHCAEELGWDTRCRVYEKYRDHLESLEK